MKIKSILVLALALQPVLLYSGNADSTKFVTNVPAEGKIRFAYDVDFNVRFDNREFAPTELGESKTLFGVRPDIGLGICTRTGKVTHRLLGGASVLYDFGGGWTIQPLIYYEMGMRLRNTKFEIVAGAFPRSKSKVLRFDPFYSSGHKYADNTFEGLQFSWSARGARVELGLDWRGMIRPSQPEVREEFVVYTGGYHAILPYMTVGYDGYLHHYAHNCAGGNNVVDDILFSPYVEFNFAHFLPMQALIARVNYFQAFERDRAQTGSMLCPGRGELYVEARNWNVGICNDLFFGADTMPYYFDYGPDGKQYGSNLYMGDALMMKNAGNADFGYHDRVSVYYQPHICKFLDLRLQVWFHFNGGYAGNQEVISLLFRL